MPDVEKVIKGLECCIIRYPDDKARCDECPYESACCNQLKNDALALLKAQEQKCRKCGEATSNAIQELQTKLKAQEPVEPTIGGDADGPCGNWWYQCGKCKEAIDYHDKYCRMCGQEVKWE
jgi:hypothetical protein